MNESASADRRMPTTGAELRARIGRSRTALDALVGPLSEARLILPSRETGWSIKDHLAHLTVWYGSLLALLAGEDRAAAVGVDRAFYESHDTDALNAVIDARIKALSLRDVLAAYNDTHEQVLLTLDALTDADLFKPYSHFQPDDPPYTAKPVIGWITGNTYEHTEEHIGWIRAILAEPAH